MKFGESLSEGLVQEWKEQYVDYKNGKEKIKRVTKLMNSLDAEKAPSDTTPLLEPLEECQVYVPELQGNNSMKFPSEIGKNAASKRRTSVFGLSTRSVADDLSAEKQAFNDWIEGEVTRVEAFYREKERDIYYRFLVLEDQFHQLREQKLAEVQKSRQMAASRSGNSHNEPIGSKLSRWNFYLDQLVEPLSRYDFPSLPSLKFMKKNQQEKPEYDPNYRENQIRNNNAVDSDDESIVSLDSMCAHSQERSSGCMESGSRRMESSGLRRIESGNKRMDSDGMRCIESGSSERSNMERRRDKGDYVHTKTKHTVPYFYARKRLKGALIEHYRSIALVKSYRTMNRTALRKIVKKFDKATNSKTLKQFIAKIDEDSYFQTSQVLDQISNRVEDLFLSFYSSETAEKKQGLERLKAVTYAMNNGDFRTRTFHETVFSSGLLMGVSLPFFGMGLYQVLRVEPGTVGHAERRYLLQIWAGFLLVLLAVFFVAVNFLVFARRKINYKFIFEFNLATALDHRQMFLLPSAGFALMSVCGWLSFMDFWPRHVAARTWPLIYLATMLVLCLWPGRQLYRSSREWVQIALWRIVCSGFYPVEFRDFFIGDILCSLTYSLGNLAFFLCLYADKWRHYLGGSTGLLPIPAGSSTCGSSHSHTMGFLTALPSVWRFLQCLRRFTDSGDAFPHLANMLKYLVGALYYCFLSFWRIYRTRRYRVVFIIFASINSIFCTLWDIIMDWSLGQTSSRHFLLRNNLFLGSPAWYYMAIVSDVILRFQWIFYAFFSSQIQQSAITSFCISLAELIRRFVWMFFRMENEHCTNVYLFRASRENALPYPTSTRVEHAITRLVDMKYPSEDSDDETKTVVHGSPAYIASSPSEAKLSRRKSTFQAIAEALNKAHVRDFQRKKLHIQEDSDDDDDDNDTASK